MKLFKRFLLLVLCAIPSVAGAQIATTAGSNLTAWNGTTGATNNNNWNQMMNSRGATGSNAKADFGNCNSLILRCAQPKCSGCTSMELARPIVSGCVTSNDTCKKHGDDLVEFISAQIVAEMNNKMQQQQLAAQQAAAAQAAAQNNAQLQQMQAQMQQMQMEMQQQNAQQMQQMQAALEEQKALTAQAMADAAASQQAQASSASATSVAAGNGNLSDAQVAAANAGVSAEILAREQIAGEIMSKLEGAEVALKSLRTTMQDAFKYANCDEATGENCVGPKRVSVYKNKARKFFDPYNDVLDELYDALIQAQAVGVDITDIYMMLNGACNVWGEYLCSDTTRYTYTANDGYVAGQDAAGNITTMQVTANCKDGRSVASATTRGGVPCTIGQVIPAEDSPACTLQKTLSDQAEVRRNWLYAETGDQDDMIRVGCASSALESSMLFRNRKKQASIDIEVLERILAQDAPATYSGAWASRGGSAKKTPKPDGVKYCAIGPNGYAELERLVSLNRLPEKVCVKDSSLQTFYEEDGVLITNDTAGSVVAASAQQQCKSQSGELYKQCVCDVVSRGSAMYWDAKNKVCACPHEGEKFNYDCAMCLKNGETCGVPAHLKADKDGSRERECRSSGGSWSCWGGGNGIMEICDCECPEGYEVDPDSDKCIKWEQFVK
ncbi:MAG: hypothetical protein IJD52_02775 [Alphaproteobacteria bacterium]|nr:hypothetical protein [Alphaproteobacteria bacterium]